MSLTRNDVEKFTLSYTKEMMHFVTIELFEKQNEFRKIASFGVTGDDPGNPYSRKQARRLSKDIETLHKDYRLLSNGYENKLGR